jgi:hypothetical protein
MTRTWEHGYITFALLVYSSLYVHVKDLESLDGFSRNLVLCSFTKIYISISVLVKI